MHQTPDRFDLETADRGRPHLSGVSRLGATIAAVVVMLAAWAATATVPAAAAGAPATGWVRVGHFAPSEGLVDFYADGTLLVGGIGFKQASEYVALPAGLHEFTLLPAGTPDAEPIATAAGDVPVDGAVTVGAVSTRTGLATLLYNDELITPEPGQSLVRFIHATPETSAVDVQIVGGPTIVTGVPYPQATDYQAIAPGQYDVDVIDAVTGSSVLSVNGWSIEPGTQASIVIVQGADGRIDVAPLRDAVAVAAMPVGGVATDLGRSTPSVGAAGPSVAPWLAVVASGVMLVGFALHRRLREVHVR